MSDPDMIQRLTNLAFSLLGSGRARDSEWIRTHVEGYPPEQSNETFARMLQRDILSLRRAGVPVAQQDSGYLVERESYELPGVSFTPAEARVLGMAGEMGRTSELGAFARSGWTKLAAAGATRDLADAPIYQAATDLDRIAPELVRDVGSCIHYGLRLRFDYRPVPTQAAVRRTMDPWGIVHWNNRIYLVGHDIDRDAPRAFRAMRCANVGALREQIEHPAPENLVEVVQGALSMGRELVDAQVTVPVGTAKELADAGRRLVESPDIVQLRGVDKSWLVRTAVSYAPEVEVIEPADVRAQVLELLKESL